MTRSVSSREASRVPPSLRSYFVKASSNLPRDGKSEGLEKEQTLSVQEKVGHWSSSSAMMRVKTFIEGEELLALIALIRAASLSIHSMTLLP